MLAGVLAAFALQPDPGMLRRLFEEALQQRRQEYGITDSHTAQAAELERRVGGARSWNSCGVLAGRVVIVTHAQRGDATRIISMRKANRREQEIYQERLGQS